MRRKLGSWRYARPRSSRYAEPSPTIRPQLLVTLIAYEGLRPEESVALTETRRRSSTRLFIGPRTMEYYLHKVFAKLDIRSRNELVRVLPDE